MANKKHVPDEKTRKQVEAMSSYGIPQKEIAKVIGIADKTLSKHYRHELDTAETKANAMVAGKLYKKCMDGDTTCLIFWLKTRARWSEKDSRDREKEDEIVDEYKLPIDEDAPKNAIL